MERTVLKCSLGLILNNFYKKFWSRNKPLKSLIHADDDLETYGTHVFLIYVGDVNSLGKNINAINKNHERKAVIDN
jgi:hypothetical protein